MNNKKLFETFDKTTPTESQEMEMLEKIKAKSFAKKRISTFKIMTMVASFVLVVGLSYGIFTAMSKEKSDMDNLSADIDAEYQAAVQSEDIVFNAFPTAEEVAPTEERAAGFTDGDIPAAADGGIATADVTYGDGALMAPPSYDAAGDADSAEYAATPAAPAEPAIDKSTRIDPTQTEELVKEPREPVSPTAGLLQGAKINDIVDMENFDKYLAEYESFWDFPTEMYTQPERNLTDKSALQLMFAIDTTGSMSDELSYLQNELTDVITRVKDRNAQIPTELSVNFYRDEGDDYVVKNYEFTDDIQAAIADLNTENADGGGDYEEAVEQALNDAINNHAWNSSENTAKLLFLVLDAPPHATDSIKTQIEELVKKASENNIVILPLASSGIDKDTERLLRQFAVCTGGTYQFLVDNSLGIGDSHLTPSDKSYEVMPLNDLLVEIINSYL